MSKSKAYRLYGRKIVDAWIRWGLLPEVKDGDENSKIRLDTARLNVLARSMHRCEFYENERGND